VSSTTAAAPVTPSVGVDAEAPLPNPAAPMHPVRTYTNLAPQLRDIAPGKLPRHIAVIMDGNGRWAVQRKMPRVQGHRMGAHSVVEIVDACADLREMYGAPEFITLYSFSVENWKRPPTEVEALMQLYIDFLSQQRPRMAERNVRYNQIGRHQELPDPVLDEMQRSLESTRRNTGLTLTLAINYGSRTELTDAIRSIAEDVKAGQLQPHQVNEAVIESKLYTSAQNTAGGGGVAMPDVDLLIRTAGEMRVSNYLLWQISYAELVVSQTLWPDFSTADLHRALREYAGRNRRFGALDHTNTLSPS
jgi:undecaprenyl diphosphate synthase